MSLVLKLISSPWFWMDAALSVLGGVLVWYGLILEKSAEKEMHVDLFEEAERRRLLKAKKGWRILMTGIVIEVVSALIVSVMSGLEIADAKGKAAEANLESKQAIKMAAESNERAAKFDADRVLVEKEAEEIRSTNFVLQTRILQLEHRADPRTISAEQKSKFIELTRNVPKWNVGIGLADHTWETQQFADKIGEMLSDAGFGFHLFSAEDESSIKTRDECSLTVELGVKSVETEPVYAGTFQQALESIGICTVARVNSHAAASEVIIIVHEKQ